MHQPTKMRVVPLLLMAIAITTTHAADFYVATNGVDAPASGSAQTPYATIAYALNQVPDGSVIRVQPGTYSGRIRVGRAFSEGVWVRSEERYRARLRAAEAVLTIYSDNSNVEGITFSGFDIAHSGPGAAPLVVQIQDGFNRETRRITLIDNVLRDSYNNDILKINNGASQIRVIGNLFYNQGASDEHIDVNSVEDVLISDNIFFNDYAASGRADVTGASSFIVVKDSNENSDEYLGARNVRIRRNLFLSWIGSAGSNFLLIGEDGQSYHEAFDVTAENNLFLGNSNQAMRAAFGVKGSRDVLFRANTVVGDLPASAFAMRLNREGANLQVSNVRFYNNVWSDPTGTMGSTGPGNANDFSDTPPADLVSHQLDHNLYFNGGAAIPNDPAEAVNPNADANGVIGDPRLAAQASLQNPYFRDSTADFNGGYPTIRAAFVDLVERFGKPDTNSAVLGRARADQTPADDILGLPRGLGPFDLGAVQRDSSDLIFRSSVDI